MIIKKQQDTDSLREILTREGYNFPCGGKGLCGRCKIIAPSLDVTALDRRFIGVEDLKSGVRLACDKTIVEDTEIECLLSRSPQIKRVEYPQIAAILTRKKTELALIDEDIVDSAVFPFGGRSINSLRAAVGKNSVEFFEKYKAAKAVTVLVAGETELVNAFAGRTLDLREGAVMPASDFDMPAEEVYFPPIHEGVAGSDTLLELMPLENGALLYVHEQGLFAYKGENVITARLQDINLKNDISKRAVRAAVRYFYQSFKPQRFLVISDNPDAVSDLNTILEPYGITAVHSPSNALDSAAKALTDNKYKTRLNKLSRITESVSLADSEIFQDFFSE